MALTPISLWTPIPALAEAGGAEIRVGIDTISLAYPTKRASDLEWDIITSYIDGPDPAPKFRKLRNGRITTKPLAGFHFGVFNPDSPSSVSE
jgi:hypothetical protein